MEVRTKPLEHLFDELKVHNIQLSPETFVSYSQNFETPEEMSLNLSQTTNSGFYGHIYYLILELWRRLLPEKQSLSTFCAELDHLISLYENDALEDIHQLQDAFATLQYLLDENVDEGISKQEAFQSIQNHLEFDLEAFLFIYILNEVELGDQRYASELIEGYYDYVKEKIWFDYLIARNLIAKDPEEGYETLEYLIQKLKEQGKLELELEILSFLSLAGNHSLFLELTLHTLFHLENEEDLLDVIHMCIDHFHDIGLESISNQIEQLLSNRIQRPLNAPFSPEDPDLVNLHKILSQKVLIL